jgi:hypothetical protein
MRPPSGPPGESAPARSQQAFGPQAPRAQPGRLEGESETAHNRHTYTRSVANPLDETTRPVARSIHRLRSPMTVRIRPQPNRLADRTEVRLRALSVA